ncbi:MAG: hypothetical protein R2799_03230 [Crocinitomicaceae bacterium]
MKDEQNNEVLAFRHSSTNRKIEIPGFKDLNEIKSNIKEDAIHFGMVFPNDFNQKLNGSQTGKVKIFHNSTKLGYKEQLEVILI